MHHSSPSNPNIVRNFCGEGHHNYIGSAWEPQNCKWLSYSVNTCNFLKSTSCVGQLFCRRSFVRFTVDTEWFYVQNVCVCFLGDCLSPISWPLSLTPIVFLIDCVDADVWSSCRWEGIAFHIFSPSLSVSILCVFVFWRRGLLCSAFVVPLRSVLTIHKSLSI